MRDTRVKYNGTVLNDIFKIADIRRSSPEFSIESMQVDGADGEVFEALTVAPHEVVMTAMAVGNTSAALQRKIRKLMDVLNVKRPRKLVIADEKDDDGNQLYRLAVPSGTFDIEQVMRAGRLELTFRQLDPYLYGKERSVVLTAGVTKKIRTGGNAPTWPVAVAKFGSAAQMYQIRDMAANGDYVTFRGSFTSSTTLTLDAKRQKVTQSGGSYGTGIVPGSRFFALDGEMSIAATAKTTLSWTERWL